MLEEVNFNSCNFKFSIENFVFIFFIFFSRLFRSKFSICADFFAGLLHFGPAGVIQFEPHYLWSSPNLKGELLLISSEVYNESLISVLQSLSLSGGALFRLAFIYFSPSISLNLGNFFCEVARFIPLCNFSLTEQEWSLEELELDSFTFIKVDFWKIKK